MPVDTSFYQTQQATPTVINPLQIAHDFMGTANAFQQNKLLQQEVKGKVAIGKAIQGATDPNTGILDQNEFTRRVASDPDAQVYALKAAQDARAANPLTNYMGSQNGQPVQMQAPEANVRQMNTPGQQANPGFAPDQVDKMRSHINGMKTILQPLVEDPDPDESKVHDAVINAVSHPDVDFNATQGAAILSGLPSGPGGTPANSQQLKPLINQKWQQLNQAEQALNAQHPPQQASVGTAVGLPPNYESNQHERLDHYKSVLNDANTAAQTNAVLSNILSLSKSGAPTGTVIGRAYEYLADKGIAPPGMLKDTEQLQEIKKYMSQAAIAGGIPTSDNRLEALQEANTHSDQLPQTIQSLIPFLQAVNDSKNARANYYRKTAGNGMNPDQVTQAQSNWNNNFDPRLLEMQKLTQDPAELKKYVSRLSKEEKAQLLDKYNRSKKAGILGQ